MVLNVEEQRQLKTIALGNHRADQLWPTHDGNLIVKADNEFWLYNGNLERVGRFVLSEDYRSRDIEVSPDGRLLIAQNESSEIANGKRHKITVTQLLQADSLTPVAVHNLPRKIQLTENGIIARDETSGSLYLVPFSGSERKLLAVREGDCRPWVQAIGAKHFVVRSCSSKSTQILNENGEVLRQTGHGPGSFAQTCISGRTFVLGFQEYSKMHFIKNLNLLADLAGADDPSDLVILRAYSQDAEAPSLELKWKPKKSEPMFDTYDNNAVGLSPDGEKMAIIHGRWLEVYRVPVKP